MVATGVLSTTLIGSIVGWFSCGEFVEAERRAPNRTMGREWFGVKTGFLPNEWNRGDRTAVQFLKEQLRKAEIREREAVRREQLAAKREEEFQRLLHLALVRAERAEARVLVLESENAGGKANMRAVTMDLGEGNGAVPGTRWVEPVVRHGERALERCKAKSKELLRCYRCGGVGHKASICNQVEKCFRCGGRGHKAKQCQKPKRVGCFGCGAKEHRWKACPKKAGSMASSQQPRGVEGRTGGEARVVKRAAVRSGFQEQEVESKGVPVVQVSEVKPIEDVDVNEHEGVNETKTGDVERDCTMERRGSCTEGAGVRHSGVNDYAGNRGEGRGRKCEGQDVGEKATKS